MTPDISCRTKGSVFSSLYAGRVMIIFGFFSCQLPIDVGDFTIFYFFYSCWLKHYVLRNYRYQIIQITLLKRSYGIIRAAYYRLFMHIEAGVDQCGYFSNFFIFPDYFIKTEIDLFLDQLRPGGPIDVDCCRTVFFMKSVQSKVMVMNSYRMFSASGIFIAFASILK